MTKDSVEGTSRAQVARWAMALITTACSDDPNDKAIRSQVHREVMAAKAELRVIAVLSVLANNIATAAAAITVRLTPDNPYTREDMLRDMALALQRDDTD